MAGALEEAFIKITGDLSEFDEGTRKGVQRTFREVRSIAGRAMTAVTEDARSAGASIQNAFGNIEDEFFESTSAARDLADTIERLRPKLNTMGDAGEVALNKLEDAVRDLANRLTDNLTAALRQSEGAFDNFSTNVRQSFGRAIVAGPEEFEASFTDMANTVEEETNDIRVALAKTLDELGNTPELQRLQSQFNELENEGVERFQRSLEEAKSELRDLFNAGELSAEEFEQAIAEVERELRGELEPAFGDIRQQLRLLRGDASAFDEITRSIDQAADETEELQDALLRLERRDHNELAEGFERGAREAADLREEINDIRQAVARLDSVDPGLAEAFRRGEVGAREFLQRADRVEEELEQVSTQARHTGRVLDRSMRRGNDRFGSLVASANRFRFVMLDLQFVAGAVGAFIAQRFASFAIDAASSVEQARLSLQVLTRSIEGDLTQSFQEFRGEADRSLDRIIEFARETPFSLEEVTDAVRRLNAFLPSLGIAAEEQLDTIAERTEISIALFEDMGAALSILGQADAMPRLIKALGDVGAAGRLLGQDLRQIRNALPGLNIREAIITGIFDPAVQSTESIESLREQFSELGADASQAPVAATEAFVDLQRRGLITTDAVVQGLRASLQNLAGDDALEAFTLTIDGVIEKLREAAEVGSAEGLSQLAPQLVQEVLPALELVEDASERFARGLSEAAIEAVPLLLTSFEDMTAIAGEVFDDFTAFIQRNGPLIEESLESIGQVGGALSDALFELAEAALPLGPIFGKLVVEALTLTADVLEVLSPGIEAFADLLEEVPGEALLLAAALFKVHGALKALEAIKILGFVNGLKLMTLEAGGLASVLGTLATRIAPIAALVGVGIVMRDVESDIEAAKIEVQEFADAILDLENVDSAEDLHGRAERSLTILRRRLQEAREVGESELEAARTGILAGFGRFVDQAGIHGDNALGLFSLEELFTNADISIRTVFNPALREATGQAKGLHEEITGLEGAIAPTIETVGGMAIETSTLERALGRARLELVGNQNVFEDASVLAQLTTDDLLDMAFAAGAPADKLLALAQEGVGPLKKFIIELLDEDFPGHLEDVGIKAKRLDLDNIISQANTAAEAFEGVATKVQESINKIVASTDPVFGVIDAIDGIASAEQAHADAVEEVRAAQEDLDTVIADHGRDSDEAAVALERLNEAEDAVSDAASNMRDPMINALGAVSSLTAALEAGDIELNLGEIQTIMDGLFDSFIEDEALAEEASRLFSEDLDGLIPFLRDMADEIGLPAEAIELFAAAAELAGEDIDTTMTDVGGTWRRIAQNQIEDMDEVREKVSRTQQSIGNDFDTSTNRIQNASIRSREAMRTSADGIGTEAQRVRTSVDGMATGVERSAEQANLALLRELDRDHFDHLGGDIVSAVLSGTGSLESRLAALSENARRAFHSNFTYDSFYSRGRTAARALSDGLGDGLELRSPSKVMMRIASQAIDGVVVGVENNLSRVVGSGQSIADALSGEGFANKVNVTGTVRNDRASGQSTGLSVTNNISAPRPREVAARVTNAISDTVYLNTGRAAR